MGWPACRASGALAGRPSRKPEHRRSRCSVSWLSGSPRAWHEALGVRQPPTRSGFTRQPTTVSNPPGSHRRNPGQRCSREGQHAASSGSGCDRGGGRTARRDVGRSVGAAARHDAADRRAGELVPERGLRDAGLDGSGRRPGGFRGGGTPADTEVGFVAFGHPSCPGLAPQAIECPRNRVNSKMTIYRCIGEHPPLETNPKPWLCGRQVGACGRRGEGTGKSRDSARVSGRTTRCRCAIAPVRGEPVPRARPRSATGIAQLRC
jgi:hypothetical protein